MNLEERNRDEKHMKRVLALAARGAGRVSPNPLVGAVLVKNGQVVGEGYHLYQRREHAEAIALSRAGRHSAGATLYVNLEPCTHYGRTPPCVDRILEARLAEVFVATRDPNRLVAGKGIRSLRKKGIRVHEGLLKEEASRLNEKFIHFMRTGRPFALLKLAMTLDGKIAAPGRRSRWITGAAARKEAHRLRYEYDAVLVGIHTVLQDDPLLNVRWVRSKAVTRVILDARLRTPLHARIFRAPDPVVIFHSPPVSGSRVRTLGKKAALIAVKKKGQFLDWDEILEHLGQRQITSLLIEGGGRVAASALQNGVVQKVAFFYAPKILGGEAIAGVDKLEIDRIDKALALHDVRVKRLSPDFLLEGYL